MKTIVLTVDPLRPQPDVVRQAADVLLRGGLVVFPTETVYGLGADASSEAAVRGIFAAKGRPSNNPVIVHVNDAAAARRLCTAWPDAAEKLAERLWPGPLTMVLPKAGHVPDVVTAGGPTVAVRVPDHPIARALIEASGLPLAAPSANLSTRVSAVRAEHVLRSLDGRVDMVLDGGPTSGGLESTVVDLSGPTPRLLRPGLVSATTLSEILGVEVIGRDIQAEAGDAALPSPGLLKKHYSPTVPVLLANDEADAMQLLQGFDRGGDSSATVGWITHDATAAVPRGVVAYMLPNEPAGYAARLYDVLHELEARGVAAIIVRRPPSDPAWAAIADRLQRAAAT